MANPNEDIYVEKPFLEQLSALGWDIVEGDKNDASSTMRENFRDIIIESVFKDAVKKINLYLGPDQVSEVFHELEKINETNLFEANEKATELLLKWITVDENRIEKQKSPTVKIIDFENPLNNDFKAISQYKVNIPGTSHHIIPDIVLFVNGIPIWVVECKSPKVSEPMEEAINQLQRYQNNRGTDTNEGSEKLFYFNQLIIASSRQEARVSTILAPAEHYKEWKDSYPTPTSKLHVEADSETINSQQILIEGLLKKENLCDIINNFIIGNITDEGKKIKMLCRYQQYRAVCKTIKKLEDPTLSQAEKGGIVWHTQGSGKSLTMVFLIRRLRKTEFGRKFKIIFLTDRTDLQRQIGNTAKTIGETIYPKKSSDNNVKKILAELKTDNSNIVNAMIQKFQEKIPGEYSSDEYVKEIKLLEELNDSSNILLLIDEAHRTQSGTLWANLSSALPNAIKIGFTGTPIITDNSTKKSHEIFWEYIDTYTIEQAVADGATVHIIYKGMTSKDWITDKEAMDKEFEDMFKNKTAEEKEAILKKHGIKSNYLDAPKVIEKKAQSMVRYYIESIFVNGFKAQVVVNSRKAAITYKEMIDKAILEEIDALKKGISTLDGAENIDIELLRTLSSAVIISWKHNDKEEYKQFTNSDTQKSEIENFKKPFKNKDPKKTSSLGFIIVKDMLLTGFDAPIEQVLFLDRKLVEHNLLQTIARVNRTATGKNCGYLVDYYGVWNHLKEALEIFSNTDIEWALKNLDEEIPKLVSRHRAVAQLLSEHGITSISSNSEIDMCIDLLEDVQIRARFTVGFKAFAKSIDIVSPDKAIMPYINDFKIYGFILMSARNRYKDKSLNILGAWEKVKKIIDKYVMSQWIDPTIPPISIMDTDFKDFISGQKSDKAKASEMEHALRFHISENYEKDEEFYKELSEKLEEVIKEKSNDWKQLQETFKIMVDSAQTGRGESTIEWIDRAQMPIYALIQGIIFPNKDENVEEQIQLISLTINVFELISDEVWAIDFWRTNNETGHKQVKRRIGDYIQETRLIPVTKLDKKEELIDKIFSHARHNNIK